MTTFVERRKIAPPLERLYVVNKESLAQAFTVWENDYRENPGEYATDHGEPEDYGQHCAKHLIRILNQSGILE